MIKTIFLCNKILGFIDRMKENENLSSVCKTDIYLYFENFDNDTIQSINIAIVELSKRGLIEIKDDYISTLYPGTMIE